MYHVASDAQKAMASPIPRDVPSGELHAVRVRAGATRCGRPVDDLHDFPHLAWSDARTFGSPCLQCSRLLASDRGPVTEGAWPPVPDGVPAPEGQADLLAIVAHALLHPVVAIATGAQMLHDRADDLADDLRAELLRLISQRCLDTASMLEDMVHGGRPELVAQLDSLTSPGTDRQR